MKDYILECCVDSVESALEAQKGGANRVELCSALVIGGLSPSVALFEKVKQVLNIKIHVLLRPRFGDFCYTDYEHEIIKEEVRKFRELGADGVAQIVMAAYTDAKSKADVLIDDVMGQATAGIPMPK